MWVSFVVWQSLIAVDCQWATLWRRKDGWCLLQARRKWIIDVEIILSSLRLFRIYHCIGGTPSEHDESDAAVLLAGARTGGIDLGSAAKANLGTFTRS